jgi:hypothetical protein
MPLEPAPLFKHKRWIIAAMLLILAVVNGAALYVRPLSGTTVAMHSASPEVVAALPASRL